MTTRRRLHCDRKGVLHEVPNEVNRVEVAPPGPSVPDAVRNVVAQGPKGDKGDKGERGDSNEVNVIEDPLAYYILAKL